MAERKAATKTTKRSAPRNALTSEEREAIRARARETKGSTEGEAPLLAKVREMPPADRALGERIHALVTKHAPTLTPRTWYGMPAYAKDGDVLCFFQAASKFKARYATLGFSDEAHLDEGRMWATSFALKQLGPAEEARIVELLTRAVRSREAA